MQIGNTKNSTFLLWLCFQDVYNINFMIKLRLVLVSSISYVLYNDKSLGLFLILDQTITHTSLTGVLDYSSVEVLIFKQFIQSHYESRYLFVRNTQF